MSDDAHDPARLDELADRERALFDAREPSWRERWSDGRGAIVAARLNERVTLILFGGVLPDHSADWLEPQLERMLDGGDQLHFIDQSLLETPNAKIRNLYMSTLRQRRADLRLVHVLIGGNAVLRMITSAANLVLGNIGMFHPDRDAFDRALDRVVARPTGAVVA